jgi:hypothetical protein
MMGFLNDLIRKLTGAGEKAIRGAVKNAANTERSIVFEKLPASVEEMKTAPGGDLKDPFAVAALTVTAYAKYPENPALCYEMLNMLRGPRPLSEHEKAFIRDRFMDGKDYVPRSYFKGAVPANNYTPSKPYTVTVSDNPYSRQNEGYLTLYVTSGGADSPRPITLRQKASTQEWFFWDTPGILADIRVPKSADPWA